MQVFTPKLNWSSCIFLLNMEAYMLVYVGKVAEKQ